MQTGLSSAEKKYLEEGVALNVRNDGRDRLDYRYFTIETGVISQANGSARVRLDSTDVLVGVKADLAIPLPDKPKEGIIKFSVECSPSISPEFEGRGADDLNQQLTSVLTRLHQRSLPLETLCLIPAESCLILNIDAMILDSSGNLFDTLSIAVRAALHNTRIPRITINSDGDIEISDDPFDTVRLEITEVPICITMSRIGNRFILDATEEEELCAKGRVIVGINKKGNVVSMEMGVHWLSSCREGGVDPTSLCEVVQTAQKLGVRLIKELDAVVEREEVQGARRSLLGFIGS